MPAPERRRPARRRPSRLRCETCLDVLTLRHAWDVASCSCGALTLSGRPTRPVVHWLSRPGGGWTDLRSEAVDDRSAPDATPADATPADASPAEGSPARRIGFAPTPTPTAAV